MAEFLRDPILYPNWVWLLGLGLVLIAVIAGATLLLAYRFSRVHDRVVLHSLSQVRRERYERLLNEIHQEVLEGQLSSRHAHLALSSLIRAAASERLKINVESLTVAESRQLQERWPALVDALRWCEEPSFGVEDPVGADGIAWVQGGLELAQVVINQ